ncbi:MAG: 3'-5' exonuclease [Pyramidobacter sp.]|uniref:3'-5' exonuclease n=1 Tax=Pyramidobacter sp. TaxID=1943581 RepID=UPI002A81C033|nr:3'-5' exonuclease [Pyramidobacter sp.]MDY4032848.1 3'-5' exonuclease [Pyramidobacter sp.]
MPLSIAETGFTALDIETTGLSPALCGIVEIAALKIFPDGSQRPFQMLVDPGRPIPRDVSAIHGIDDAMVRGQPRAADAVAALVSFVGPSPLVLHNAPFDMSFLNPVVRRQRLQWSSPAVFDTLKLSRQAFPGLNSYSLENLSRFFDFDAGGHHRALTDCRYCAQLFARILRKIRGLDMDFAAFAREYASSARLLDR